MSYVDLLDVNEEAVIRAGAREAGVDPDCLMDEAKSEPAGLAAEAALREYESAGCPGVPPRDRGRRALLGQGRVDWLYDRIVGLLQRREGAVTNG